ncbi:MAG: hypothetical protein ACXU7D_09755, partial [Burkholderiaceae bacterium]
MHHFYHHSQNTTRVQNNGDPSCLLLADFFQWLQGNLLRIITIMFIMTFGLAFGSSAHAGNAATGSTLFHTTYSCNGCHDDPPSTPQLNAAGNASILSYAIT